MTSSTNLNDEDLLLGALNVFGDHLRKKMQNSLPVKVTKVSGDRKFVDVQPQIMLIDAEDNAVVRGEIKGVPVITSGAGDFLLSFPIKVGDKGWIETSDRDISLFKQSYAQSKPNTKRMHDYADSRFVPDIMENFTIDDEDSSAAVIQNRDNTVKISLDNERIKIKCPKLIVETTGDVEIICGGNMSATVEGNTELECTGDVNVTAATFNVTADGGANINGFTIDSSGAAVSPSSITSPSVVVNGKEMDGHKHGPGDYEVSGTPVEGDSGVNK
jgi:hypothetical protein